MEFDSSSVKCKELEKDGCRYGRVTSRVDSWSDRNRDIEATRENWKRRQPNSNGKDGDLSYDSIGLEISNPNEWATPRDNWLGTGAYGSALTVDNSKGRYTDEGAHLYKIKMHEGMMLTVREGNQEAGKNQDILLVVKVPAVVLSQAPLGWWASKVVLKGDGVAKGIESGLLEKTISRSASQSC
ncbi:hypothetical protein Nepgr_010808 [Nepenthes gracilis]|uniref:Uncharacterized protein n=1 Tax=Nepenthes gracilis TaxID=150966 RepID=A0AAD3XLD4_NEPGR|nr:hypothetical protein Nepgr_010808 [Nepenthes gracilis]